MVVCYVSTWAVYRPDSGKFSIENIDPNLCTHLVYAFAGLDKDTFTIKSTGTIQILFNCCFFKYVFVYLLLLFLSFTYEDPWQDLRDNYGLGGYERITNLRKSHPHLKVIASFGDISNEIK